MHVQYTLIHYNTVLLYSTLSALFIYAIDTRDTHSILAFDINGEDVQYLSAMEIVETTVIL